MKAKIDLHRYEDNWVTDMGGSIPGKRVVVRGKDLFDEFSGERWQKLLLFMITGRLLEDREVEMMEQIWTLSSSYPDPRVWNNRVAALAATTRSTMHLGLAAATAVTEARIYGGQAVLSAADFLLRTKLRLEQGVTLKTIISEELKTTRAIAGYGRPIVGSDERIRPIEKAMKSLSFSNGNHVKLAYKVEDTLKQGRWRMQMNISALAAAISADIGLTPKQFYLWSSNGFSAGMVGCFTDAEGKPEGSLFPMKCKVINYSGSEPRAWK